MKMENEKDPEKTNLLRGKKRKSFGSRNKTDQGSETSSMANGRLNSKRSHNNVVDEYFKAESFTAVAQEKKEKNKQKKKAENTPSCTSCILNRITNTSYCCCTSLLVALMISLVIITVFIYRSISCSSPVKHRANLDEYGSDMFRRNLHGKDRKNWNRRDNPLDIFMTDFNDASLRESNSYETGGAPDELSGILQPGVVDENSSAQLRDFYKRLLETDAKLNKLKTAVPENAPEGNNVFKMSPYRKKRSLKFIRTPKNKLRNNNNNNTTGNVKKSKNETNHTAFGFVIEKEKVFVKYAKNDQIKEPKTKRTEQDTETHENELKHPFYKNTQKVYKILSTFLKKDQKVPSDNFYQAYNELNTAQKYNDPKIGNANDIVKGKNDMPNDKETNNEIKQLNKNNVEKNIKIFDKRLQRKLLQIYEEDTDASGARDAKEVLNNERRDTEVSQGVDLMKNEDELQTNNVENSNHERNFANQIGSLIKYIVLQNMYTQLLPKRNKEIDNFGQVDNEAFIEDYSKNQFDTKNNVAQTYSDYGVLDSNKETINDINPDTEDGAEKRVKLSVDKNSKQPSTDDKPECVKSDRGNKIAKIIKHIQKHFQIKEISDPIPDFYIPKEGDRDNTFILNNKLKKKEHTPLNIESQKLMQTKSRKRTLKSVDDENNVGDMSHNNSVNLNNVLTKSPNSENVFKKNDRSEINYVVEEATSSYEMRLDNNAYRLRNLLSVDEDKKHIDIIIPTNEKTTKNIDGKRDVIKPTNSAVESKTNIITTTNHYDNSKKLKSETKGINKTIVKRSALDDGNSIFWEDVYDDEYGANTNENKLKDSTKDNEFSKKSEVWFYNKMQKLKDKWRTNRYNIDLKLNGTDGSSNEIGLKFKTAPKRAAKNENQIQEDGQGTDFAALTAKMKEVCKQAAAAIQQTRNIKAREKSSDNQASTTLMQQLLRLMNDLVDFQVQQRTCIKLPPDLRNFLVWLTSPGQQTASSSPHADGGSYPNVYLDNIPRYQDLTTDRLGLSDTQETLQSVQDLLLRYQDMSDDDKSKMSGVKEYLENKLNFLNKMSGYDNIYNQVQNLRYKRNSNKYPNKKPRKIWHFIHKHKPEGRIVENKKLQVDKKNNNGEKRNIQDVYYRAVADAKKLTTPKALL